MCIYIEGGKIECPTPMAVYILYQWPLANDIIRGLPSVAQAFPRHMTVIPILAKRYPLELYRNSIPVNQFSVRSNLTVTIYRCRLYNCLNFRAFDSYKRTNKTIL